MKNNEEELNCTSLLRWSVERDFIASKSSSVIAFDWTIKRCFSIESEGSVVFCSRNRLYIWIGNLINGTQVKYITMSKNYLNGLTGILLLLVLWQLPQCSLHRRFVDSGVHNTKWVGLSWLWRPPFSRRCSWLSGSLTWEKCGVIFSQKKSALAPLIYQTLSSGCVMEGTHHFRDRTTFKLEYQCIRWKDGNLLVCGLKSNIHEFRPKDERM